MEIALTVIGILIAIFTLYYTSFRKPTDELNNFKAQFRATQKLSRLVQKDIEEYADRTNSWGKPIFPEISFRTYLNALKDSYEENLSDKCFTNILELKLTKLNIESMTKSLETQQSALLQIQAESKMRLRQLSDS